MSILPFPFTEQLSLPIRERSFPCRENCDGSFTLFGIRFVYDPKLNKFVVEYADGVEHCIPIHCIALPNGSYWVKSKLYIFVIDQDSPSYIDTRGDRYIAIARKNLMNILSGIFVEKEMLLILIKLYMEEYGNYIECNPIYKIGSLEWCKKFELPSELKDYFTKELDLSS